MKNKTDNNCRWIFSALILSSVLMIGCQDSSLDKVEEINPQVKSPAATPVESEFNIQYEQYQLANGLKVILHQDKSDPIVAMTTLVHVGSSREKAGKTGFAHFFEHMSFNDSENVPKGSNRKLIPELGGERNGGTWSDGTIYYEVVPKDAFDKLLWIDSDRLGFMINTVDQGTLEREKQVVKNEKRQRVDNRPYGHTSHVIKKALYPTDHPYNWTVIGDLADLQAASLNDVREFYDNYYVPANATLVIAGDIDIEQTKTKVENWFGEIKKGEAAEKIKPRTIELKKDIKLYHLDNFAKLPEIRLTFPTIQQYHPDSYALNMLGKLLSEGKNAALYKNVVANKKLAPNVYAYNYSEEIAGTFTIQIRANVDTKLDNVYAAINESLIDFEKNGFSDDQLTKLKAESETQFFYEMESVLNKAQQLATYNEYAGSPDFIKQDLANILAVSRADVLRVFKQYIKNKPAVITSFVPKDQQALVLSGSTKSDVTEEEIVEGAEETFVENDQIKFQKTITKFDRSEPALTELPTLKLPDVWHKTTENGIKLYGIQQTELPIVNFLLRVDGGQLLDQSGKEGIANLMAELMNEGTATKTPQQLEEAIGLLGASLSVNADGDSISVYGRSLAKNFAPTIQLVSELLLTPRWDPIEFERLKAARLTDIQQSRGNAQRIASQAFMKLLYGEHPAGIPVGGTEESVNGISLQDLKDYYSKNISPKNASLQIVGDVSQELVEKALVNLKPWRGDKVALPELPIVAPIKKPVLYFIDLPNAKQSVLFAGKTTVSANHPDFYPIEVANNNLGGDMSARLSQTLRIEKGYTYGAYSYISPAHYQSPFIASSQVRTNVTLESLQIFKDLIGQYKASFTENDLAITKNMILKSNSRRFETLNQLLGMLNTMSSYNLDSQYIEERQDYVSKVNLKDIHQIIENHLDEQKMIYLVVGDAKTQLAKMKDFGYGEPIVLDLNGEIIK